MMRSIAATLSLLALEACVHEQVFEPAAGASLAPGRQNVAEAIAAGVTVKAARDSWKGDPKDLGSLFTPVRVIIQNHSWKPLRVSYGDFSLSGASAFQYAAIPPIKARGTVSASIEPSSVWLRLAEWEQVQTLEWQRYPAAEQGAAQHAATLEALDILRNAEWMLATGNSDGVDDQLANAQAALSGRTRLDLEAARGALANEDLFLARQYLAAAVAERRFPR